MAPYCPFRILPGYHSEPGGCGPLVRSPAETDPLPWPYPGIDNGAEPFAGSRRPGPTAEPRTSVCPDAAHGLWQSADPAFRFSAIQLFSRNETVRKPPKSLSKPASRYHRQHPWRLREGGLYIPHVYEKDSVQSLTWWDDFGFIFAKRRVMVWWQHPRMVYRDLLRDKAEALVSRPPSVPDSLFDNAIPLRTQAGKGRRKRVVGFVLASMQPGAFAHYALLAEKEKELARTQQDLIIHPSCSVKWYPWGQGVDLVLPVEVRGVADLQILKAVVEGCLRGYMPRPLPFPDYGFSDWVQDGLAAPESGRSPE